nr:hypothetical protein CFP56_20941 [Quercus suber]
MAEALAGLAVASITITILQITEKVVIHGRVCVRTLRDTPKKLEELMQELTSLHGVLATLQSQLAAANQDSEAREVRDGSRPDSADCRAQRTVDDAKGPRG